MIEAVHPVLRSGDLAASLAWYARLGFGCVFVDRPDLPRYAVIRRDGAELHLQTGEVLPLSAGGDRPVYRVLVREVDRLFVEFHGAGVTAAPEETPWAKPADTPWGTREFHVRDPDGNGLQFYRLRNESPQG